MPKFFIYLFICAGIFLVGCDDTANVSGDLGAEDKETAENVSDNLPDIDKNESEEILDITSCDDEDRCTEDVFDAESGSCRHSRMEICCGDGFCDFSERCDEEIHNTVCPSDCPRTCSGVLTLSEFSCEGSCTFDGSNFIVTGSSILKAQLENIGELPLGSLSSSFSCRNVKTNTIYYDEKNEKDVYNGVSIKDYFEGNKNKVLLKGRPFPDNTAMYYLEITGVPEKTKQFLCTIRFTGSAVYSSTELKLNFEAEGL